MSCRCCRQRWPSSRPVPHSCNIFPFAQTGPCTSSKLVGDPITGRLRHSMLPSIVLTIWLASGCLNESNWLSNRNLNLGFHVNLKLIDPSLHLSICLYPCIYLSIYLFISLYIYICLCVLYNIYTNGARCAIHLGNGSLLGIIGESGPVPRPFDRDGIGTAVMDSNPDKNRS